MTYTLPYDRKVINPSGGLNTSQDPSTILDSELTVATGGEYVVGSPHLYKQPGRAVAGTLPGATQVVRAVQQLQYDSGTSAIAAYGSDGVLYESAVALALTFSAKLGALTGSAVPSFNAFNDRWVMTDGVDTNFIREAFASTVEWGYHTSASTSATVLTDANKTSWATNQWLGATVTNVTDGSTGTITSSTTTTVTSTALAGGATNLWHLNDVYTITSKWRVDGMQAAYGTTSVAATGTTFVLTTARPDNGTVIAPHHIYQSATSTGTIDDGRNAADADPATYAFGAIVYSPYFSKGTMWEFTSSVVLTAPKLPATLNITHSGFASGSARNNTAVDYTFSDADPVTGTDWQRLDGRTAGTYPVTNGAINIPSGTNLNQIRVRALCTVSQGYSGEHRIHDISVTYQDTATAAGNFSTENPLTWMVTERFVDGDGIVHESNATTTSAPLTLTNISYVDVFLPPIKSNSAATHFVIYRSVDVPGGGFPQMWEVGTIPISTTYASGNTALPKFWRDTLDQFTDPDGNESLAVTGNNLYKTITVLYPDGSNIIMDGNSPPPLSTFSLTYQGSVVYFPAARPRTVAYSVPTSISPTAAEQVPSLYYLDFQTPTNDTATTGALCNGGRSLIVMFPAYSMLVNYLPQANDPGVFDTRVKEYVSETRGAAGRFCATPFTPGSGLTVVAAVDKMGVWVTDGVSGVQEWTKDLEWTTTALDGLMDGVNLTTAQLRNNQDLRRLELLFTAAGGGGTISGRKYEMHFFYGDLKPTGLPKITGPHAAGDATATTPGWASAHYTFADTSPGRWLGWKGSGGNDGRVYLERMTTAGAATYYDASRAYNANGHIAWVTTGGDFYLNDLGQAVTVELGVPKFDTSGGLATTFTIVGTFRRDGAASAITSSKSFVAGTQSKLYWHRYADRHTVTISDISATAAPPLVGYEIMFRGAGISREGPTAAAP